MDLDVAFWRDGYHFQTTSGAQQIHIGRHASTPSDIFVPGIPPSNLPRLTIKCDHSGQEASLTNVGSDITLTWTDQTLGPGQSTTSPLPFQVRQGTTIVEIRRAGEMTSHKRPLQSIAHAQSIPAGRQTATALLGQAPSSETLASWFEALGQLQRSAASSREFFEAAAGAVVDPGGLDAGFVVLNQLDATEIVASDIRSTQLGIAFGSDLVEQAVREKSTLYHPVPSSDETPGPGDSAVAAPIFNAGGDVCGVIYGVRSLRGHNNRCGIRPLEALWVQLLADAVSAGIQRVVAEAESARTRVLFEQAFSSELVTEILRNPRALEGQERQVSVLFCDVRESTRISDELGPKLTSQLLSDILEYLTAQIIAHEGVIIDYYGDGLAAMWNAPRTQPEHAVLACQAAVAMVGELNGINERWCAQLHRPVRLGIGINTAIAQVGNSGTTRRLKYGPRGKMVTLASRLENATKLVGVPILVSPTTCQHIEPRAITRRICRAKLHGIVEPVDLIELVCVDPDHVNVQVLKRIESYELALAALESGRVEEAERLFVECDNAFGDAPARNLIRHARRSATHDAQRDQAVVDLS